MMIVDKIGIEQKWTLFGQLFEVHEDYRLISLNRMSELVVNDMPEVDPISFLLQDPAPVCLLPLSDVLHPPMYKNTVSIFLSAHASRLPAAEHGGVFGWAMWRGTRGESFGQLEEVLCQCDRWARHGWARWGVMVTVKRAKRVWRESIWSSHSSAWGDRNPPPMWARPCGKGSGADGKGRGGRGGVEGVASCLVDVRDWFWLFLAAEDELGWWASEGDVTPIVSLRVLGVLRGRWAAWWKWTCTKLVQTSKGMKNLQHVQFISYSSEFSSL